MTSLARSLVLLTAALLLLAGCATIRRQQATSNKELLAAAGFQTRSADTPEGRAQLDTLPPLKLVRRDDDGSRVYMFSDPQGCHCLYVGGPTEYSKYQRLRIQRRIAADDSAAALNRWPWGPWWGPWGW
jgi:uncharacterized protein YceK